MKKPVILTGIRANNELTLGNYFGAIMPMIDMAKNKSNEYQVNLFIPDLHSFTTPIDHTSLYSQIMQNARIFTAAGLPLDNDNIHIYRQSYIPAHSELTWILNCFTGFGEMSRMIQFKDKSSSIGSDRTSVGLFNYPVLMAADILLYDAMYVPVGEDQTQHLEYTRDIADRMNARFGTLFTVPEQVQKQHDFFGKDQGLKIKDLVTPTKKMSKSEDNSRGVIYLSDNPEDAAKKVMSATTDNKACIRFDRVNQPGISNLLEILSLLRTQPLKDTLKEYEGSDRYGDFKQTVGRELWLFLSSFQENLRNVNDEEILKKLEKSEREMNKYAADKLLEVQKAVGLRM